MVYQSLNYASHYYLFIFCTSPYLANLNMYLIYYGLKYE